MAGIGFELRKLFKEEGIVRTFRAFGYSTFMTVGPMLLCIGLVLLLKEMMGLYGGFRSDSELFIATMTYCFIFSIILTCGLGIVLTRFVADQVYEKKYDEVISSLYGALLLILPLAAIIAFIFLRGVSGSLGYKMTAYLLFMELVILWIQTVYISAMKDYARIFKGFAFGIVTALFVGWILFQFTAIERPVVALLACVIGIGIVAVQLMLHFEQVLPRSENRNYFGFLYYFRKFPALSVSGIFVYSGVFVHNFVYWLQTDAMVVADGYRLMPFYDLPVFYGYLSVVPSLVLFIVIVETAFYEKYRIFYSNVVSGAAYERVNRAKESMQSSLLAGVSFLIEVQLLFSLLSVALGLLWLPKIGFTMEQLDLFVILVLGFFFFIITFVLLHLLMYFDDKKGVFFCSSAFFLLNGVFTFVALNWGLDGAGLFAGAVVSLAITILRLLHVLRNIHYFTFCPQPLQTLKRKRTFGTLFLVASSSVLLLSACSPAEEKEAIPSVGVLEPGGDEVGESTDKLREDKRIYERDTDDSVKALYVTVWPDEYPDEQSVDWYTMNRITERMSTASLQITVEEGLEDGKGPRSGMFGYGADSPNAKISLRGNSSRYASQKSYKIKLFDETGLWHDQRTFNLNKHSSDFSRIRNKLSFDLMETIPDMTSLRTQFVHLYVKDLTKNDGMLATFEDYGLYTHVEQPNEKFLKSHWLDPYGYLYKVTFFEFQRYPDELKATTDPTYNEEVFETILEIKGRKEHDKLIAMLEDVNDMKKPIEEIMETHFDMDNFLTWTAVNILMDNMDTDANNFYLYSPLNSDKWFILPWDYDGGWELQREKKSIRPYQAGISNYWGNTLHNRFFRKEEHVQMLIDKVEELGAYVNEETVKRQLDKYTPVVEPFLMREPDLNYLPKQIGQYPEELQQLIDTPKRAVDRFLEDLQKPKPFYMDEIVEDDGTQLTFSWQISFDLQGDDLYYTVQVAKDPLFTEIIHSETEIRGNQIQMPKPENGIYYWKVTVRDSEGHEQTSFDMYMDEEGDFYYGILPFEVN
ncbi:exopolysaccharide Pel transporter PelG [Sporosarcina cyprini]|uniref:exopolysaccharide Pel transporter PelG n=1 Tax=Sporosarcina cyprini TaxID=2910523 RepID=UPI001EDF5ACE|nr:exopolysaccharide Pel transporter PelG [Sporosarcina cyprini]MCG3088001.1 exopolysaccharide Pel transporter PelG [Sporosarcina cyprini]